MEWNIYGHVLLRRVDVPKGVRRNHVGRELGCHARGNSVFIQDAKEGIDAVGARVIRRRQHRNVLAVIKVVVDQKLSVSTHFLWGIPDLYLINMAKEG